MRYSFVDVAGTRTRYLHAGSGQPVILVHGVGLAADSWFRNVPALAQRCAVYAPDLIDNGMTEAGPYRGGTPQPFMVDHLLAFADALGLETFTLVGSSLGSSLAILLYFKAPQRIDRLVLVGPGSTLLPVDEKANPYQASYLNGRQAIQDPTYDNCRKRMGRAVYDVNSVPDALVLTQMLLYALPGALESFERRLMGLSDVAAQRSLGVYGSLEKIEAPSLVIVGREDPRGDYALTTAAAARLPNSRIVTYERCGHWPHLEHPDKFNRDVIGFLSEHAEPMLTAARTS